MKIRTTNPTPAMIRAAREAAGLSQPQAAEVAGLKAYQRWAEYERDAGNIDNIRWQWFLLQTGQHPTMKLAEAA